MGYLLYQLVQDFFHQQYQSDWHLQIPPDVGFVLIRIQFIFASHIVYFIYEYRMYVYLYISIYIYLYISC